MKKIIVLLSLVLLLSACSDDSKTTTAHNNQENSHEHDNSAETINSATESDHPSDENVFIWENTTDGIKITDYIGNSAKVIVPETINNKLVMSVGSAFNGNVKITDLTLSYNIDQANLENCTALTVLTIDTDRVASVYPAFRLPQNLKKLNCPQLTVFSASMVCNTDVETLYCPSATRIYKGYWTWPDNLKEVTLSAEMLYYGIDRNTNMIGWLSIESNTSDEIAITEENRAFVYCSFFGKNEIKVNGKLYTYNGELG